jgi:hypothetical protein
MFHLLLRPILLLTLLAALPIALIRAQPYDDTELRAFLTPPDGCPAPCFIGIRPGVTTAQDAAVMLTTHALLLDTISPNPPRGLRVRASRPDALVEDRVFSYLDVENNVIQWIQMHTNISLADVWMAFGPPDWGARTHTPGSSLIYYAIGYNQMDISFEFVVNIEQGPIRLTDIFHKKLTLRLGNTMKRSANMNPSLRQYTSPDLSWWRTS